MGDKEKLATEIERAALHPPLSSPRARADVRAAIRNVPVTHRFPRRG